MSIEQKVQVKNAFGLHTRPAVSIAKMVQESKSEVTFTYQTQSVNAGSILDILNLAVGVDSSLTITVAGDDAEETMKKLVTAFETRFQE